MDLIQNGESIGIPQTKLAKDDYRRVSRRAWDAKHNLDVASRLVRDLPTSRKARTLPRRRQELWTDLPAEGCPDGCDIW